MKQPSVMPKLQMPFIDKFVLIIAEEATLFEIVDLQVAHLA